MAVNETNDKSSQDQAKPDLDSAAADDWPAREFPITGRGQRNYVQVVMRRSVLNEIHEHGRSNTGIEVCGVLVGDGYRDERGPFLYVQHIVQGEHSDGKAAQVTFTAETWNHIQTTLDQEHPDLRIVGWYHTHPGFGIFLSDMDMFIHENFFGGDEQLALVYDPIGGDQGLFVWRDGKAVRDDGLLIEEDVQPPSGVGEEAADRPALTASAGQDTVDELESRLSKLERRLAFTSVGLCVLTVLAIAWPVAAVRLGLLEELQNPPKQNPADENDEKARPPIMLIPVNPKQRDDTATEVQPEAKQPEPAQIENDAAAENNSNGPAEASEP